MQSDEVQGGCHCGTVRFRVRLTDGLNTARRCTCSYCRMRGAVAVSAQLDGLEITAGQDALATYQFGVNAACLEGVSPFDFKEVPVLDGVNHPNDTGGPTLQVGVLRFVPPGG